MKSLKLLKLSLAIPVAAFVAGAGTVAHATNLDVSNGLYVFTSTDPSNTTFDGSSVTFTSDVITSWDLLQSGQPSGPNDPPLTPSNSSIIEQGVLGLNEWYFEVGSPVGTENTGTATFFFEGANNLGSPGVGGGTGWLSSGTSDPAGNWNDPPAVPDAANTLELFAVGLAALVACQALSRRQAMVAN